MTIERKKIMLDYTGFDEKIITARCGDTEIAGKPLTINYDGSVCLASSGETFLGFGVVERNNFLFMKQFKKFLSLQQFVQVV